MSHTLCNYTAYIACDDTHKLVNGIVVLCEKEGMQRFSAHQWTSNVAMEPTHINWSIRVMPGAPGWHVLDTDLWDMLSGHASGSDGVRLVKLCESLRLPGFAMHVSDAGPWGEILLETDGLGKHTISGYWSEEGNTVDYTYFGLPLRISRDEKMCFRLLDSLQVLLEDGRDFKKCGVRADNNTERVCTHFAQQLGGATEDLWWQWNCLPEASVVLYFACPILQEAPTL
jgi:hypothetical protein